MRVCYYRIPEESPAGIYPSCGRYHLPLRSGTGELCLCGQKIDNAVGSKEVPFKEMCQTCSERARSSGYLERIIWPESTVAELPWPRKPSRAGGIVRPATTEREYVLGLASDLVTDFTYYDRKDDEEMPCERFKAAFEAHPELVYDVLATVASELLTWAGAELTTRSLMVNLAKAYMRCRGGVQ